MQFFMFHPWGKKRRINFNSSLNFGPCNESDCITRCKWGCSLYVLAQERACELFSGVSIWNRQTSGRNRGWQCLTNKLSWTQSPALTVEPDKVLRFERLGLWAFVSNGLRHIIVEVIQWLGKWEMFGGHHWLLSDWKKPEFLLWWLMKQVLVQPGG